MLVLRLLFWALCVGAVFVPLRLAFFCLIVVSHLDVTTPSFTSASSVGFDNSIRIVGLPAILLWRMQWSPMKNLEWTLPVKLWALFIGYVALAVFWADYRLSGLKMVVYLVDYLIMFALFSEGWSRRLIDVALVRSSTWAVLLLAFVQTYVLGNMAGTEDRLTTYTTAQYFAAYLLAALAILVFSDERGWNHYSCCVGILVAIVLSGSRYIFVSTVLLLGVISIRSIVFRRGGLNLVKVFRNGILTVASVVLLIVLLAKYIPSNRIDAFVDNVTGRDTSIEDVGTFAWRTMIYSEIEARLERRPLGTLLFGSGTSSGADVLLDVDPDRYASTGEESVDGNRVLHSEFLRAAYEWGLPGFFLLVGFMLSVWVAFTRRVFKARKGPALSFVGVFPSMVFGLAIENILAGAASAAGVGITMAMAYAWRCSANWSPVGVVCSANGLGLKCGIEPKRASSAFDS